MGRKAKIINLTSTERAALEQGYKNSGSSVFSRRCHMILLKSEGLTFEEIAKILGMTQAPIQNWVKRYKNEGIEGLKTRPGQGRKVILDKVKDAEKVKAAVKKERQRLKHAKDDLEQELNKEFSLKTLKRFLKNLSADGNVSG